MIVSEDPGRTFAEYAPHLLYWFNAYSRWFAGSDTSPWPQLENQGQILSLGLASIVTPEDAVTHLKARTADVPVELFTMMLMPPCSPLTSVQTSLELFANKVMPYFE